MLRQRTVPLSYRLKYFVQRSARRYVPRLKRRYYIYTSFLLVIMCFYCYWLVMLKHGTFLPPFTFFATRSLKTKMANQPIPSSWTPDFRVVVSFSTLPHHMADLNETIDSLLQQSLAPHKIYLNVPQKSIRTGNSYAIPSHLTDLAKRTDSNFEILESSIDYGPLTKLYPTLEVERDDETLIITVDDDKVYPADLVKTIAWYSHHHPFVAWGECGWGFQRIPEWMSDIGVVPVYVPWMNRFQGGTEVEVLQAVCGNGYRRSFFRDLTVLAQPPRDCFTTDDLWISGYLKFYSKVPRVLMKDHVEPWHTEWKAKMVQTKTDLSWFNSNNNQDIKCIRAVENLFDQNWL